MVAAAAGVPEEPNCSVGVLARVEYAVCVVGSFCAPSGVNIMVRTRRITKCLKDFLFAIRHAVTAVFIEELN